MTPTYGQVAPGRATSPSTEATEDDIRSFGPRLVVLAAERTLLVWLSLCLALISLGFALDRSVHRASAQALNGPLKHTQAGWG